MGCEGGAREGRGRGEGGERVREGCGRGASRASEDVGDQCVDAVASGGLGPNGRRATSGVCMCVCVGQSIV